MSNPMQMIDNHIPTKTNLEDLSRDVYINNFKNIIDFKWKKYLYKKLLFFKKFLRKNMKI